MKFGAGLALIAVGAILAFAVTANTSVFNVHTAGWVLMIVGVIGIAVPRATYGWVGRRVVRRSYPTGQVQYTSQQPYARNQQALQAGAPTRPTLLEQDDLIEDEGVPRRPVAGTTEVVEDTYEQP
jgi:hypothetical protein